MNTELFKSKTFWAGVAGVITAVGGAVTGAMSIPEAVQLATTSFLAIFIRDGISKSK